MPPHPSGLLVDRLVWDRRAATPLSFGVEAGQRVYVCGQGAGALLLALAGFLPSRSGRILCEGRDLTDVPAATRHVAYIAGGDTLLGRRTLRSNVTLPGVAASQAETALAQVGLAGEAGRATDSLSTAQRRLGALARALATGPALLLIEEAADDPPAIPALLRTLDRPASLVVTASPALALAHAEAILLLGEGRVAQLGTPHDLYERPADGFAATWCGPCNLIPAVLEGSGSMPGSVLARVGGHLLAARFRDRTHGAVRLAVRPHQLVVAPDGVPARLVASHYRGADTSLTLEAAGTTLVLDHATSPAPRPGEVLHVTWDWRHAWPVPA